METKITRIIYLTNISCLLIQRELLENRLEMAKLYTNKIVAVLTAAYRHGYVEYNDSFNDKNITKLIDLGFIFIKEVDTEKLGQIKADNIKHYEHNPLHFTETINFELTYECNSKCPHCLLKTQRQSFEGQELSFDEIKKCIADSYFAGIIRNGINFTGGEALLSKTNIFELIEYASSYGIPTRLYTNTFWGNKVVFTAGNKRFATPLALVRALKNYGLSHLAISFDSRIDKDKEGVKQLASVVHACETVGLRYELVATRDTKKKLDSFISYLNKTDNHELKYMSIVVNDLVDMGGVNDIIHKKEFTASLNDLVHQSHCKIKGYYSPTTLTINPEGGVRSCMYGLGLDNLGSIRESSFINIINRVHENDVSKAFSQDNIKEYADKLFEPFKHIYIPFEHPCTACVLIARLIQEYHRVKDPEKLTADDLLNINKKIATELNLLKIDLPIS